MLLMFIDDMSLDKESDSDIECNRSNDYLMKKQNVRNQSQSRGSQMSTPQSYGKQRSSSNTASQDHQEFIGRCFKQKMPNVLDFRKTNLYEMTFLGVLKPKINSILEKYDMGSITIDGIECLKRNVGGYLDLLVRSLVEKSRISNASTPLFSPCDAPGDTKNIEYYMKGLEYPYGKPSFRAIVTSNIRKQMLEAQKEHDKKLDKRDKRQKFIEQVSCCLTVRNTKI